MRSAMFATHKARQTIRHSRLRNAELQFHPAGPELAGQGSCAHFVGGKTATSPMPVVGSGPRLLGQSLIFVFVQSFVRLHWRSASPRWAIASRTAVKSSCPTIRSPDLYARRQ